MRPPREAVLNAVYHRDYAEARSVQVRIYDDRLEVWNPGGLPYGLSLEDLYHTHRSRPRNKRLADAFFRAGLIEAWGTGTLRIVGAYTSQGLPAPQFVQEMGQFIVRMLPTPPPFKTPSTLPPLDLSGLNERQRKTATLTYVNTAARQDVRGNCKTTSLYEKANRAERSHDIIERRWTRR